MKEYKLKIDGKDYAVSVNGVEENIMNVVVNGKAHKVELESDAERPVSVARPTTVKPSAKETPAAVVPTPSTGAGKALKSPLPGVILDIFVNVGDTVKNGQKVLLLEAMKMENNIDADKDGVIVEINVAKGNSVNEGDTLMVIG